MPRSRAIDAREIHLFIAVVPAKQDVAPVDERAVALQFAFDFHQPLQDLHQLVEVAAPAILHVAFLHRAVDGKRDFIDARFHKFCKLFIAVEQQSVGAGEEIDLRMARLGILDHFNGFGMNKALAVVEEVDALQSGAKLIDDFDVRVVVKQPHAAREMDAVLMIAARFVAGEIARHARFDEQPAWRCLNADAAGHRSTVRHHTHQVAMSAKVRIVLVQSFAQSLEDRPVPDFPDGQDCRVAGRAFLEGIGASANDGAVRHERDGFPGPVAIKALAGLKSDGLRLVGSDHLFSAMELGRRSRWSTSSLAVIKV